MTELLFQTDAYVQNFTATVTAQVEGGVVLDRTAFYPGGGGQPNDVGTLTAGDQVWAVHKMGKVGGEIVHFIQGDLPAVDTTVTGQLDWTRRYQLMRTHTAMHILCGVVWRDYGAQVTGGAMEPLEGRMDFEFATLRAELVGEIEAKCNVEIAAAHDVRVQILPRRRSRSPT